MQPPEEKPKEEGEEKPKEEQQQQQQSKQQEKPPAKNYLDLSNKPIPPDTTVIHFEVCINCQKSHSFCTQHDELRYAKLYHEFKEAVEAAIPNSFCVVNHSIQKPSIGAFEITHQNKIIYSKKNSGLFPCVAPTVERIKRFLDDLKNGKDVKGYATTKEKKQEKPIEKKSKPTFQAYIKMKEEEFARQEAIREENERKRKEQEEKEEKERQERERIEAENKRIAEEEAAKKAEEDRLKKEEEDKIKAEEEKKKAEEAANNQQNQEGEKPQEQAQGEKPAQ
ncbi:unnamed protein product [Paramecium pentaurelia]|uniref:Uncharacterized protein n=1 Tax=Paramecium pentaurelia TaxID=43138 RepID=A0A8S1XUK1_9CILI|nr:unnamed protein product [Paramecium pentaurelia]